VLQDSSLVFEELGDQRRHQVCDAVVIRQVGSYDRHAGRLEVFGDRPRQLSTAMQYFVTHFG